MSGEDPGCDGATLIGKKVRIQAVSASYAVGARWMLSAVARIYRPGAKADCCLILEGPQGIKKSTALRTLAGEYFTDELADLGSKDAALQIRGVWIVEISELDSLVRSEIASIKAFMSRTADRFRPPFGKRVVQCPRQCVFAGTVNHTEYLRDETGARRFWPVLCGLIDIEALARDRGQLWAEAKHRYSSGEKWWLDASALVEIAAEEQSARYQGDPWEEIIAPWLDVRASNQSRNCLRNVSRSRKRNGLRATRTGLAAVCELWAGSGIANASAIVSNGAGGGLPNEPFRVVLRLVPGLFYVKCLQRRMFYVFHAFSRGSVYTRTTPNISPTPAYRPWNTQNTWNKECFQYREAFHVL